MANAMDVALANCGVFTWQHAHDVEVALVQYKKANGIASPLVVTQISLFHFWLGCCFGFQDLR